MDASLLFHMPCQCPQNGIRPTFLTCRPPWCNWRGMTWILLGIFFLIKYLNYLTSPIPEQAMVNFQWDAKHNNPHSRKNAQVVNFLRIPLVPHKCPQRQPHYPFEQFLVMKCWLKMLWMMIVVVLLNLVRCEKALCGPEIKNFPVDKEKYEAAHTLRPHNSAAH